jgi:hypothetical protein
VNFPNIPQIRFTILINYIHFFVKQELYLEKKIAQVHNSEPAKELRDASVQGVILPKVDCGASKVVITLPARDRHFRLPILSPLGRGWG